MPNTSNFLYGFEVKGIQRYIFHSNKLKDIAGASALIESISTSLADQFILDHKLSGIEFVRRAAGSIWLYADYNTCKKWTLSFPLYVQQHVPNIDMVQAVVPASTSLANDISTLWDRLQAQSGQGFFIPSVGYMGIERIRLTGELAYYSDRGNPKEKSGRPTQAKQKQEERNRVRFYAKFTGLQSINPHKIPLNTEHLTTKSTTTSKSSEKSWIALIYIDGNNMGKLFQRLAEKAQRPSDYFSFSEKIKHITVTAANEASQILHQLAADADYYPLRPIILGGDDVTVLTRADLALQFAQTFIQTFERQSKEVLREYHAQLGYNHLTACGGIAFIKAHYPFFYAIELAGALTKEAKQRAKHVNNSQTPSAVSLYRVLSSFVEPLDQMKKRTHFDIHNQPIFEASPYFIHHANTPSRDLHTLMQIVQSLKALDQSHQGGANKLRQLLQYYKSEPHKANLFLNRLKQVNPILYKIVQDVNDNKGLLYDAFQIYSLT